MTHDELLDKITNRTEPEDCWMALRKVVELHKPYGFDFPGDLKCDGCRSLDFVDYPCPTIQAIEKELNKWDM
jgi:hypothetical protein